MFGIIMSTVGMRPDPAKIAVIQRFPTPENGDELQSFLGIVAWMRSHTRFLANMTADLEALKFKKKKEFIWTPDHQKAFEAVKQAIAKAAMRYHPLHCNGCVQLGLHLPIRGQWRLQVGWVEEHCSLLQQSSEVMRKKLFNNKERIVGCGLCAKEI